ncbi:MAG: hypothetical protein Q4B36_07445 [Tissierellia bacterium]|nr:hypothetical protein [Tissierellia bacterium]
MDKAIKDINDTIESGKKLIKDLERSRKRIRRHNDFKISRHFGRNFVGDRIRSYKVSMINKDIERCQEEILEFDSKVKAIEKEYSNRIDLPYKLPEFGGAKSSVKDLSLRIKMRMKQLDVEASIRETKTVIKKLIFMRNKIIYNERKKKELAQVE